MNSPVEEIKARLNIVELVGAYVRLQKSGTHWKAPCPFHNEKSPSFMVNEERQMWHCFGCNKGGDAFAFLMEIEGIDFKEALRLLAERTGVELPKYSGTPTGGLKDRTYEILELATKFYEKQLWDGLGKRAALAYLRERGLMDETMKSFRLGYAPDGWRNIHDFLVGRGYTSEELEKAGLVIRKDQGGYYDRFRDRIMFPIMDVLGRVIGYSARVTPGSDESQAKYINTPETGVYHKSHVLYGIQLAKQAMKSQQFALLVEGNMDVIAAHQAGIANTVAVSGTALTSEQLALIKRYTDNLRLFFDMDGAGQAAARRSAELCLEKGLQVWIVAIPQGKDAADLAKDDPEALRHAIAHPVPALQYFLDKIIARFDRHTPDGKRRIAEDYITLLRHVVSAIDQAFWLRKLSETLDVEEGVLRGVLQKLPALGNGRNEDEDEKKILGPNIVQSTVFHKRSELLRRKIVDTLVLNEVVWKEALATIETSLFKDFMAQDEMYCFVRDRGESVEFSLERLMSVSEELGYKQEITRMYFEGEKLLESSSVAEDEGRVLFIRQVVEQYMAELAKEWRRERLVAIEKEMREARIRGDRQQEQALSNAFQELLQQT